MCDTIGVHSGRMTLFAKNSDRSPNEPQILEYCGPREPSAGGELRVTYCSVEDIRRPTRPVLLSRPVWMWGAEMGVNDVGVCIGNEAVFTRGRTARTGLTGMDLLRLALERSGSAEEAVSELTGLLGRYGQGGDCGYDHPFYYDNSFLIADRETVLVLETAGREWAVRRSAADSISNRLCIGRDGTAYSGGRPCDFAGRHTEPLITHFSGSAARRAQTQACLAGAESAADLIRALRSHSAGTPDPFAKGTVDSCCMHAGGIVGDHTTASMAAEVSGDTVTVYATGCSLPCISLFKPWRFGGPPRSPVYAQNDPAAEQYWTAQERRHRKFIGRILPAGYFTRRDALEKSWAAAARGADGGAMDSLSALVAEQEIEFEAEFDPERFPAVPVSARFGRYWAAKNAALGSSCRPPRSD